MERSEFVIDRSLYSEQVVTRAAHRHTAGCAVEIMVRGNDLVVALQPRQSPVSAEELRAQFFNDLLDERLRDLVRVETQGLEQELVRAALTQAMPSGAVVS
ncbi:hypothetical protein NJG16_01315 [Stenotrophomonas maltophilia]|uniref:hypothetical protein n=1 Tax=Stenotrophomonas lactitubi TaxID=2045214 RepID=UPI00203A52CE|nr:hypothetical protein [Stenotrophomonas lactitubi]MCO7468705.1 hypothetical protein [Stenotrophomonas maltophilia]